MNHPFLLTMFIVAFCLEFAAFGMQRTALLISREAGVPYQVTAALLPSWFAGVLILQIAKWCCLAVIAFTWSWFVAGALIVADFVLSAILPIPYSAYTVFFRKRASQIKEENSEAGEFLEQILSASKTHGV